jgi:TetR/AcrR family transcriptional regulator, fatty acid metabolism regulator protein
MAKLVKNEISTRQMEIIEAAGKLLSESGVGGLTIKNLAKEMQFAESAIYRHFQSKEDIVVEMLQYLAENMDGRLGAVVKSGDDSVKKFKTLFRSQFDFFSKHPHFVVAVFSDGLMEESRRINESIFKIMQVKMKHLSPVIIEGQQQKLFTNSITTEELVHIVMGTFRLLMFKWRIAGFKFDIKRNGDNMIEAILTLIRNK